jgi:hypothetical protein
VEEGGILGREAGERAPHNEEAECAASVYFMDVYVTAAGKL